MFGPYKAHEAADWFPMLEEAELQALADSIKTLGQIEPVVVWGERLVDGRNRWRACELAGVQPKVERRTFASEEECAGWVVAINVARRHLSHTQRCVLGESFRDFCERLAKERQRAAGVAGGVRSGEVRSAKVLEHVPGPSPIKADVTARDEAGKAAGVSGRALDQYREVKRKAVPEVVEAMTKGRIAVSAAAALVKLDEEKQREVVQRATVKRNEETPEVRGGLVRQLVKQELKREVAKQIEAEPAPMPTGPFRVIVSDPPWAYNKRAGDASHRVDLPYPSMTTAEICALDVASLAHDDGCVLWLWTTNAHMRDAYKVLDAWGFQEKTILTWVKDRMGMGDWLRGQTEHCILAIRGKPTVLLSNQTTLLHGPVREHSRKPDEFYAMVEALCPGSKVEMFCRTPRPGWAAWGAEKEKFCA